MSIPTIEQEKCLCGRVLVRNKPHCPGCGRSACYAKPSKAYTVEVKDRGPMRVMMYQCRGCGVEFSDLDTTQCEAPPIGMSMKNRRQVDKVLDNVADMPFEERKKLAFDMLRKYQQTQPTAGRLSNSVPSSSGSGSGKIRPFEVGDDREMIHEAIRESDITIEEVKQEDEK